MSRILVADDNSNIQKMVALALKDEGIDVVAVGNGDAAMRKIPDLRPDLVLADVFMPVRNGYEVCEFVKNDSRYMSTPVVLLVGAFDPLDEQETQRVRADGVLKKPFVPPDPLINMVKALLAKSNGQKGAPMPPAISVQGTSTAQAPPALATQAIPRTEEHAPKPQEAQPEVPTVSVAAPLPIETGPAKDEDSDEVVTAVRDPNLGEPFWAAPAEPEELEEKVETDTDPKEMIDLHSFGKDDSALEEEHRPAFRPDSPILEALESGEDFSQTIVSESKAGASGGRDSDAAEEAYAIDAAAEPAVNEAAPAEAIPAELPAEVFKFDPSLTFAGPPEEQSLEITDAVSAEPIPLEPIDQEPVPFSWPAVTDVTTAVPVSTEKPADAREHVEPMELELPALPNREAVITAATEAARLAFSELNTLPASGSATLNSETRSAETNLQAFAPPDSATAATPEMIDAVVSRLLERMQPEIMEVVNREVLRPAIEAIVRRELKKS